MIRPARTAMTLGVVGLLTAPAAAGQATAGKTVFGIQPENGTLSKYHFADQKMTRVGGLHSNSDQDQTFTGIEAAARMPDHVNLAAFWTNPETGMERLLFVNAETGRAAPLGENLGVGHVAGAATGMAPDSRDWAIFALQNLTNPEQEPVDFDIVDDQVVPREPFAAQVTVLGAAITYGGQYDIPVTTEIETGGNTLTPFGGLEDPDRGNLNDGRNPRRHVLTNEYPAGTPIGVVARSWLRGDARWQWRDGWQRVWDWEPYITVNGLQSDSPQVLVLRNGDSVPDIDGFQEQNDLSRYVRDYVDPDSNTVVLGRNEAIFLFELGARDTDSSAADFQDLVVLVTLAETRDAFDTTAGGDGGSEPIPYVVEREDDTIKFEDAPVGLGEDGAIQSDRFVVRAEGGSDQVTVTTKAATDHHTYSLQGVGDQRLDNLGFRTKLAGIDGNTYTLVITSESNRHALSHVSFEFGGDVIAPDDHYDAERNGGDNPGGADGQQPDARLLQVDPHTGGYEQLMTLSRTYDNLAVRPTDRGQVFYATSGDKLYRLDASSQTETRIGPTVAETRGLAFAGQTLIGFEVVGDSLQAVDMTTGESLGSVPDTGLYDLGTIVFMPSAEDPANEPDAYD